MELDTEAPSPTDHAREALQDVAAAIVWESDAAGVQFAFVSESAGGLLGYSAEEWQAEPGFLRRHVPTEDWCELLATLYRAAVEGGQQSCRHRLIRRDGSMLWAQTSVGRSRHSNGVPVLAGLTFDISELKRTEERLREGEFIARMLVENLRDYGVFLIGADGRVETWSTGAQRLKGYRAEEIVGEPLARFFPPDQIEKGQPGTLFAQAELDQQATYVGWMVRKGGTQFWARLTLTVIRTPDGRLRGYSNLAMDMTEPKRIEQELRENEEQFRRLVESQDYGVFMVSPEGHIQSWNRGAQRLQGYRAHQIVGAPIASLFPEAAPGGPDTSGRLLGAAERLGNSDYEGWLVRRDGSRFWGLLTASSVEDGAGHLRGFSILARDVTDRRQTEEALRESEVESA